MSMQNVPKNIIRVQTVLVGSSDLEEQILHKEVDYEMKLQSSAAR